MATVGETKIYGPHSFGVGLQYMRFSDEAAAQQHSLMWLLGFWGGGNLLEVWITDKAGNNATLGAVTDCWLQLAAIEEPGNPEKTFNIAHINLAEITGLKRIYTGGWSGQHELAFNLTTGDTAVPGTVPADRVIHVLNRRGTRPRERAWNPVRDGLTNF